MAKSIIQLNGITEANNALSMFEGDVKKLALASIKEGLQKVESAAKTNLVSMMTGDYSDNNVLLNSISHTAVLNREGQPVGDVGVYDMSRKTGSTNRRASAPLVAFFHQSGTQPHSLAAGSRTKRRPTIGSPRGAPARGQDVGVQHPGFGSSPFLDRAWAAHFNEITDITIRNLQKAGE